MFCNKIWNHVAMLLSARFIKLCTVCITASAFLSGCGIGGHAEKADPSYYQAGSLVDAVSRQDAATVEKILQQPGYNVNEVNEENKNTILMATYLNNFEIARKLIDAGANVNMQDNTQENAYLFAAAQGRTEILRYILAHAKPQPDPKIYNRFGGNALIPAAENGHTECVRLLLEAGRVDLNHQNEFGYTALIEAVALKDGSPHYQNIVQMLLDAGAKTDLKDKTGRTALDYALEKGYQEMASMLTSAAQRMGTQTNITSKNNL